MKAIRILTARRREPQTSSTSSGGRTTTLVAVAGAAGTLIGAALSPLVTYWTNERQMDVKMVEIGVGILRAEPKEEVAAMRSWAIDVIEASSRRKFTPAQRSALLRKALPVVDSPWGEPTGLSGFGPRARALKEKLSDQNLSSAERLDLERRLRQETLGVRSRDSTN